MLFCCIIYSLLACLSGDHKHYGSDWSISCKKSVITTLCASTCNIGDIPSNFKIFHWLSRYLSPVCIVSIMTRLQAGYLTNYDSIPSRGNKFISFRAVQTDACVPPSASYSANSDGSFPRVSRTLIPM